MHNCCALLLLGSLLSTPISFLFLVFCVQRLAGVEQAEGIEGKHKNFRWIGIHKELYMMCPHPLFMAILPSQQHVLCVKEF
uniref:Uncharacterized protein n=1 Tax=Salix viminalis TaxID=40686 RepID=A0A6N2K8U5_SALVM